MIHEISTKRLTIDYLSEILRAKTELVLSEESTELILKGRVYLDEKLKNATHPIYGINTGFGSLYNISVDAENLEKLQYNLIVSHACGMGDKVPVEIQ